MTSGSMLSSSSRSNEYRKTDARLVSVRSRGGRASSRAVTTAWTVGGSAAPLIRGPPSFSGKSMPGRLHDEERVPAGALGDRDRLVVRDQAASRLASQDDRLVHRERIHPQEHGVDRVRAPRRTLVQQLGPRERERERAAAAAARPRAQTFDQVEHGAAERVGVLHDDDHRLLRGQPVHERQEPCVHVVDERGFVPALGDAEQQSESVDETVDIVRLGVSRGELVEPLPGLVGGVAVLDPREVGDDRGDRGERRRLGVRTGPRHHERHPLVETGEQLVGEPRLADPRLPGDRHEDGHPGRGRAGEAFAQDRHLARSPDERDRPARGPGGESFHRVARAGPSRTPSRGCCGAPRTRPRSR